MRTVTSGALRNPPTLDRPPPGYRLSGNQAIAIASRLSKVRDARRGHRGSYVNVFEKGSRMWQVSFFAPPRREIAQVLLLDSSGRVTEAWTGFQVAWTMARGYPGAFGRKVNALYVWLPLCVLFALPFVDPRKLRRMIHLDLLMLSLLSVSLAFFNHADIAASVPLSYPPLLYLLGRMLWIGLHRGAPAPEPLCLLVPVSWLTVGLVFLVGFRVGLNMVDSNVIDVGYASVVGANQITSGKPIYGHFPNDISQGDTYGPAAYGAYVPFRELFGFKGRWDDLPAAHAAAVAFDLICIVLMILIGRRLRGPPLGWVLGYTWAAFPFTLFTLESNSNDSLVAVLVLGAILLAARAPARGVLGALAGLTKFAPFALAPLLATHDLGRHPVRRLAAFVIAFAGAAALTLYPALAHGGSLQTLYTRTIAYQSGRGSPFSLWGLYGGLGWVQAAVQVLAVALALVVAAIPRRADVVGLAALAAAITISLQLGLTHWFYLYIVWFFPLVMIALLARAPLTGPQLRAPLQSRPRTEPGSPSSAPALP
ncbi:MAG: glycosyltransferase 87 family protein [Solirubrobacteraceae bacterium]